MIKVGIIGPTNIQKLSKLVGKPQAFFLEKAKIIGKILAESNCEVWVNSDKGMLASVGKAYRECNGKRLVVLYPGKGEPWPNKHTKTYIRYADEVRREENWFWSNYNVTAIPDLCVCVGLSAGTLSELAYIKWNHQFKCGNLKKLIGIKELLRESKLPPEIEEEIGPIVEYTDKAEGLKEIITI